MVKRAKTVSTVLICPNPQLRCMQKPLLVNCTKGSIWCRSNFPAAAIFSNSSLIITLKLAPPEGKSLLNSVSGKNPREIALRVLKVEGRGLRGKTTPLPSTLDTRHSHPDPLDTRL